MEISKLILAKQAKEKKEMNEAEAKRLNDIAKKFYDWMEGQSVVVKDARVILRGMFEALEQSISAKTQPLVEAEGNKTLKAFYAENEIKN